METTEYLKEFGVISAEIANLKGVPDPITDRIAEVRIVQRGPFHENRHDLQDLLPDKDYVAICRFIRETIEKRSEELENQLKDLTRAWLELPVAL